MGPPCEDQACACVDDEYSRTQGRVSCNTLYPRKCVDPGSEEIAEDPRRRELYRLRLARNCHFINNYVPIVLLAMLSNMDFQATLTKDAVIEYMTKYMTKSGQASLATVMENSFSLCSEKAREQTQGAGSAILRWFNLLSITEVKSQLETMHLIFKVPRFICSREFRDIWLRSEVRQAKSRSEIEQADSNQDSIASKTLMEVYASRDKWSLPEAHALRSKHPLSRLPLWQDNRKTVGSPGSASDTLDAHDSRLGGKWAQYVDLLSVWQFKWYFERNYGTVRPKPRADVVVVHPDGRFTTARDDAQWLDACRWTLLAYCNHGPRCTTTFVDAQHLESFADDMLTDLAERFVMTPQDERLDSKLTACPPCPQELAFGHGAQE